MQGKKYAEPGAGGGVFDKLKTGRAVLGETNRSQAKPSITQWFLYIQADWNILHGSALLQRDQPVLSLMF